MIAIRNDSFIGHHHRQLEHGDAVTRLPGIDIPGSYRRASVLSAWLSLITTQLMVPLMVWKAFRGSRSLFFAMTSIKALRPLAIKALQAPRQTTCCF